MPAGAKGYAWEIVIWIDQGFSVLTGGYADETFSARCHRRRGNSVVMDAARRLLNMAFFWQDNHCRLAFENEKARRDMPPEYRRNT
jgi:hypothetical protein